MIKWRIRNERGQIYSADPDPPAPILGFPPAQRAAGRLVRDQRGGCPPVACARGSDKRRGFARRNVLVGIAVLLAALPVVADEPEQTGTEFVELDAPQAVRQGNSHLTNGQPDKALEAYRHAEELEPDAREIAFVEGLAHYDLKDFDAAREAFRKAALGNGPLADDALYSLGVSDHAEALTNIDGNPQAALGLLEGAMRRYHDVLARRPEHTATRDANFKAAHMWRELKQKLEQQQQQQEQDQDQESNDEDTEKQQQNQQQQGQDEEDQEQQQSDPSEHPEDQQEQQQQQKSQADKQEQVSREQAERRLREMMQAVRDRKKMRREQVPNVPIAPVDKDW